MAHCPAYVPQTDGSHCRPEGQGQGHGKLPCCEPLGGRDCRTGGHQLMSHLSGRVCSTYCDCLWALLLQVEVLFASSMHLTCLSSSCAFLVLEQAMHELSRALAPLLSPGICSMTQCFSLCSSNSVHSQLWTAAAWMLQLHHHTD